MSRQEMSNVNGKVWLLQRSDVVGGTRAIILELESRLRSENVDAEAVFLRTLVEHQRATASRWRKAFVATRDFWRLIARWRSDRPRVIVTFTPALGVLAACLARLAPRTKVVATLHGPSQRLGPLLLRADRFVAIRGWYKRIVACSSSVKASYEICGSNYVGRVEVISNGVKVVDPAILNAVDGVRTPDDGKLVALSVGRLAASKNLPILFHALAQTNGWHLVVLGDGEIRSELEELATALGIEHRVSFRGRVPPSSVASWLLACDAYVQPSMDEGLSLALLEAMAHGATVLATDVPANRDPLVGEDGTLGMLLPGHDPAAWAAALTEVAAAPEAAASLGQAAMKHQRRHFSEDTMYASYLKLVHEVLEGA